ncbi:MAG TPA: hypothetical protein VHF06_10570 [Pseudonocardiaceae bacterium]|jgi:hypothetical protein|nr:hypothetical protein [Pseudonocardiaceae bacterium]
MVAQRDSGVVVRQAPPIGSRVVVNGGRYAWDQGIVVRREPDLRPGSVWVRLIRAGTHLVPVFRLSMVDEPVTVNGSEPSRGEPDVPAVEAFDQLIAERSSLSGARR